MGILTFKVLVPFGDGIQKADAIKWREKLWLIPAWHEYADGFQPAFMIRFDSLPHQLIASATAEYLLHQEVPASALLGLPTPGFEILRESPETGPFPRLIAKP